MLALSEAAFDTSEHDLIRKLGKSRRVPASYRIWTMKEALFKLWSSAGRQGKPPSVINVEGELQLQGDGWACAFLEHSHLAIAACSALPLAEITQMEMPAFTA